MNQKHGKYEKRQNKDTTKPESVKEIKLWGTLQGRGNLFDVYEPFFI